MREWIKKEEITVTIIFILVLLWNFCILFGLWGGYPEGAFAKIKKQNEQIEILRNQINLGNQSIGKIEKQFNEILGSISKK